MADAIRSSPSLPYGGHRNEGAETRPHVSRPWPEMDVLEGGRQPLRFGEFLVQEGAIDRTQLFRAMQIQDRLPGIPIGQCVVALGYLTMTEIEWMYQRFASTLVEIIDDGNHTVRVVAPDVLLRSDR
jgi:hypothetical protein